MPNFELKKDRLCEHTLNLALDSIVIIDDDWTQGFRPMVSSALWGKRRRRDYSQSLSARIDTKAQVLDTVPSIQIFGS